MDKIYCDQDNIVGIIISGRTNVDTGTSNITQSNQSVIWKLWDQLLTEASIYSKHLN